MRTATLCLLATLFITGCASTGTIHSPRVFEEYDSVEGITYWTHTAIQVKRLGLGGSPAVFMQAAAICQGDMRGQLCKEPRYILAFQAMGERLTSSSNLTIRIGEDRLRPDAMAYGADTGGLTAFSEAFVFPITMEQLHALAHGADEDVEGRLAGMDLNLKWYRREALRIFVKHLESQNGGDSEPIHQI